jgi:hypothetical protein
MWKFGMPLPDVQVASAGATAAASAALGWSVNDVSIMWLGVPLATLMLAFAGSIVSLTFTKAEGRWWAIVLSGTLIGAVCAPLVAWGAGIDPARAVVLEKAIAFVLGLSVQVVVPALKAYITRLGSGGRGEGGGNSGGGA